MRRLRYLVASAGFLALLLAPGLASADVNSFTVTNFSADETLSRQDPQGELHIVEHINVDFTDYNHGILRAIPDSYKNHQLMLHVNGISSQTGASAKYTTYSSNGNTVLKIGDANKTVTGPQEYTIDYTLRNVISFYDNHDELYWDINGDQWQQPFDHVAVTLHLPNGLQQTRQPVCYTGGYGSNGHNCTITDTNGVIKADTTQQLQPYQTLTFVAGFQKGYFHPSKWYETLGEYGAIIAAIALPIVLIGGVSFVYWLRNGRDPKGTGVIVPQYDAPDGLKPLQVDGLMDFTAGTTGITATIVDLAIRGYVQIIETKQAKTLRKDTLDYSLKLLKTDFSGLNGDEQTLLKALFPTVAAGETTDVSTQKNKLYKTVSTLQTSVKSGLEQAGYFRSKTAPHKGAGSRAGLWVLIVLAVLVWLFFWAGAVTIVGLVIGGLIGILFWVTMDARTAKGVAAKEHAEGLKLYLNVAEKDRLEKLQGPDAAYAPQTAEPQKTVQLFEKLLPYAMVLGVEQQWAEQFKSLYTSPPDWYSGNWTTFNAAYLASNLNSGIGAAVNTAFSSPSSSSSSGFGGGFSGGGGGGGGGGGW